MTEEQELEQLAAEIAALEEQVKETIEVEEKPEPAPVVEVSAPIPPVEAPKPKRTKKKEVAAKEIVEASVEVVAPSPTAEAPKVLYGAAKLKAKFLKR